MARENIACSLGNKVTFYLACSLVKAVWNYGGSQALAHLAKADAREQKLVLADKLANMRAIARDYAKYGENLWQRFKRGKDVQSWYYHAAVKAMSDLEFDAEAVTFYKEFEDKVNQVFGYEE